ncbi:MAG: HD domain-containing protein [Desulfatibacillum sp.]|nr:HD domain-containing protein [Desulfatibacillum sp.]
MTKTTFVENIQPGEKVDATFVVTDKSVSHRKDGAPFLNLTLVDRTGSVRAIMWDLGPDTLASFDNGDYISVKGQAGTYRDQVQVTVKAIAKVQDDKVDPGDFLPVCPTDPQKLLAKLQELTATITDPFLLKLMETFWQDQDFSRAFATAPAGKKMHHAYIGGLVEHTLSVALLVDPLAGHYIKNKGVNRDLLLTGAVLHDVGKVEEFQWKAAIDYSDAGRLMGHAVIGVRILDEKIAAIPDFPNETAMLLRHMIVSHHGERDFGALEPPKTLEAVILHNIDDLDAKVNGVRTFMDQEDNGEAWTGYHRLMERHFYRGRKAGDHE